jgi:hypothetical protein
VVLRANPSCNAPTFSVSNEKDGFHVMAFRKLNGDTVVKEVDLIQVPASLSMGLGLHKFVWRGVDQK